MNDVGCFFWFSLGSSVIVKMNLSNVIKRASLKKILANYLQPSLSPLAITIKFLFITPCRREILNSKKAKKEHEV